MVHSLRFRLMLIFAGLAVLPLILAGIVIGQRSYASLEQQSLSHQQAITSRVSTEIRDFIHQRETELMQSDGVYNLMDKTPDEQYITLANLLMYENVYRELVLIDAYGNEQIYLSRYYTSAYHDSVDWLSHPAFRGPMATGEPYFSSVMVDENTAEPHLVLSVPLIDTRTGHVENVLIADLAFKPMWDLLSRIDLPESTDIYVVDQDGLVVAYRNPTVVLRSTRVDLPDQPGRARGINGTPVLVAKDVIRFGQQELTVVAERPVSTALRLAYDTVKVTVIVTAIALAGAVILAWFFLRQVITPIEALVRMAGAVGRGDFSQRVNVATQDEVYGLATAFNSMSEQLQKLMTGLEQEIVVRQETEKALRESEGRYRNLFEDSPIALREENWSPVRQYLDALGITDARALKARFAADPAVITACVQRIEVLDMNQATLQLYGAASKDDLRARGLIPILNGDSLITFQKEILALMEGHTSFGTEHVEQCITGQTLYTSLRIAVAPGHETTWGRIFVSALDIGDRIRAEEQRLALAVERERVTLLANFITDLSHEFKIPLSIINTKLYLVEKIDDQEERAALAETIENQVTYISELVDDMMMMMRLDSGHFPMNREPLNVATVLDNLNTRYQSRAATQQLTLTIDCAPDLPPIQGDPYHLNRALSELVENALQYTLPGDSLTLRAARREDLLVIEVIDTGTGIKPEDYGELFKRFGRGDKARSTRGAGLGLPMAQRIAEYHGGHIEFESEAGKGSIFRIVLPVD